MDEREKVHKLWAGLNKKIQKGLWRDKLNPEISSYDEVSHAAELVEIIENVDPDKPDSKEKGKFKLQEQRNFKSKSEKPKPKRRELTAQEKEEYRAAGKCFRCGQTGHMARQCPDGKIVTSNSEGPPGISSNNIQISDEELRELAETTEEISFIDANMMEWNQFEDWDEIMLDEEPSSAIGSEDFEYLQNEHSTLDVSASKSVQSSLRKPALQW
ncbi:hypothetical protein K435DRAFT_874582 [Dendrothele bispora CBS 962.96]|uniref:CCHC-type domain-containing protein n=1 Tax=Dendrothele bispora (strain CBS 962.96) TaxID=1314807 RepID=A0A4S8KWH3_DENBC|nr:hypothetical protein K435DRAFT_874582 [Dendrothele bispora CBS 962.96]